MMVNVDGYTETLNHRKRRKQQPTEKQEMLKMKYVGYVKWGNGFYILAYRGDDLSFCLLVSYTTGYNVCIQCRTVANKFSIGRLCISAGGLDTLKIDKNSTDL